MVTLSIRQLVDVQGSMTVQIAEAKPLADTKTWAIGIKHEGQHYGDEFVPTEEQEALLKEVEGGKAVEATIAHDPSDILKDIEVTDMKEMSNDTNTQAQ